jgi:hypothetical protein
MGNGFKHVSVSKSQIKGKIHLNKILEVFTYIPNLDISIFFQRQT